MGGGDLNTKKSWHPNTIKNQERVWKAEQARAHENQRINDLRKEIDDERSREDLTHQGQTSGVLANNPNKKMDWMYKQPNESIDREQYLLGKAIDKTFEKMVSSEQANQSYMKAPPKNHVEHECIPFSIRNLTGKLTAHETQVDMARKMLEDPLVAIRKRELESRAQLLQNPVKLKELTMLLKEDRALRSSRKKKSKKHKKEHSDLDSKLAKQLRKLNDGQDCGVDLNDLLSSSSTKHNFKKKRKSKKESSDSDSDSSSDHKNTSKRNQSNKKRKRDSSSDRQHLSKKKKKRSNRSDSDTVSSDEDDTHKKKNHQRDKRGSSKEINDKRIRHESNSRNRKYEGDDREEKHKKQSTFGDLKINLSHSDHHKSSRSIESSSHNKWHATARKYNDIDDDDDDGPKKKHYGLVKADGSKIEINKDKKETEPLKKAVETKKWVKPSRSQLSEKEMEQKRREMMQNASKRDTERERNVSYHRDQDKKREDKDKSVQYKEDFVEKHLRVAADHSSLQGRIKSNIYNIQRSNRHMDTNFAKR